MPNIKVPVITAIFLLCACSGDSNSTMQEPVIQVVAQKVSRERLSDELNLVANVTANESVVLRSEIDGKISEFKADEGAAVKGGEILILFDQEKLKALLAKAEADFTLAKANLARSQALFQKRTISSQEFDQTRNAFDAAEATLALYREELEDGALRAPFDGVMGARLVSPGQYILKGTPLISVLSVDPLKLELWLPEQYLGLLSSDVEMEFSVTGERDKSYKAGIFFVAPDVDFATRAVLLKAKVLGSSKGLRPGMFANVTLRALSTQDALVIPESALMFNGDATQVFALDAEERAALRTVKTGRRLRGSVEIKDGLGDGESVVTEGAQKLRPGTKVALAAKEAGTGS